MSLNITKKITLNTNNYRPNDRIVIKQGCVDTITLIVTINDKGGVLELPAGTTAKIRMLKPDKKPVLNDCEVVGNNVHVVITQQMQAAAGDGQCEVILFNGAKTFTTVTFPITIEPNVYDDSQIESTPEYNTLLNALVRIEDAIPKAEEAYRVAQEALADIANKFIQNVDIKPLVSFVDDDGSSKVWTVLKPMFESRNIPCVPAIIPSYVDVGNGLNWSQVKELQSIGWEIAGHHSADLTTMPLSEAEQILRTVKEKMNANGIDVYSFVYPHGGHNADIRKIIRKYYKSAVGTTGRINKLPIKQYSMNRCALGPLALPGQDTLEYYKSVIDEAVANNNWVIFMTHIGEMTPTQIEHLEQVIDYTISLGVEVVNLRDGIELYGNVIFAGDYNGTANDEYYILTNSGLTFENRTKKSLVNNATPITAFNIGDSTHTFLYADNTGFPENGAGLLLTHRYKDTDPKYSYQIFRPYNSKFTYSRFASSETTWSSWVQEGGVGLKAAYTDQFSLNQIPEDFPLNQITINAITNANAAGSPNGIGGTLITSRMSADDRYV